MNTEIKNLGAEISKNQAALDKATAIRQKELAEFNGEEKDVLQSIGALKSAVAVLGKHNTELAQVPAEQLIHVAVLIEGQFRKYKDMVNQIASPAQKKAVAAFVQAPSDFFDADPTFKQSYAPQSAFDSIRYSGTLSETEAQKACRKTQDLRINSYAVMKSKTNDSH